MIQSIKKFLFSKKNNRVISVSITVIYFLFNLYVILNHECWRDESQAWLIVKNLSYVDIFKELCVEGHPCLWFLLIAPFAKLGLSFYHFNLISLFLCTISVYIMMEKSSFLIICKLFLVFSSAFFFYNPIICRVYSLILFLVTLICSLYKKRANYPLIYMLLVSLLIQTHIMMYGLCFGLALEFANKCVRDSNKSKKEKIIICLLPIISTSLLFLELIPRIDYPAYTDTSIQTIINNISFSRIIDKLQNLGYVSWGWKSKTTVMIPFLVFMLLSIIQLMIIVKNKKIKNYISEYTISIFGIGYYLAIYIFVYSSHSQLASVLMIIVYASIWLLCEKDDSVTKNYSYIFIVLASMLTFIPAQSILRYDINKNYSNSKDFAFFIEKNIENNSIITIEDGEGYNTPVIAYVDSIRKDISFYTLTLNKKYVYNSWINLNKYEKLSEKEIVDKCLALGNKRVYYISNEKKEENDNLTLIYEAVGSFTNEDYWLYRIN